MLNSDNIYLLQIVNPFGSELYYTTDEKFSEDPIRSSIFLSEDHLEECLPAIKSIIPVCCSINAIKLSVEHWNEMCDISPNDSKYKIKVED